MRKKNSQVCDGIFDVSSPPFTGKERKNRITDAKIFEKIRIANTKWHIFSPSLSPSIRVYFRKKNRRDFRDTSRKACKSLRFGGSQEIDSWLTNREGSLRQNGLRAEYSPLSLSLSVYIYIYIYTESFFGVRAFENATLVKNERNET